MATLTIKNVPIELYESLKRRAAESRRSLNSEALVCLERAVKGRRVKPDTWLGRIAALQKRLSLPPLTDRILREAREKGRP